MPIHLTPTEVGREFGMHRREVIAKCMERGVPIFQGRIDKALFASKLCTCDSDTLMDNMATPGCPIHDR